MPAQVSFGRRVGNYYLGRTLGEGTYAKVKYGQHVKTGEAVAIKILDKQRLVRDDLVNQIKREITILKHLKHPNVVDLIEVMASEEKIYMVMELVSGGELFDKIVAEGPMSEPRARKVLWELIDALAYCHAQGIYHRDLKPENVLIASDGTAKLSDFGLGALPASLNSESGMLMTTCGTPNYVAPEVLSKAGYEGAPADIWSLGAVLYVILAGCLPYDEPTLPALFLNITQAKYEVPPWFSKQVCALLKKMMCPDPAKRITLAELRNDPWVREGGYVPKLGVMTPVGETEAQDIFDAHSVTQETMTESQKTLASLGVPLPEQPGEPIRLNAFYLISAAIDLSGMFEQRKDVVTRHTRFTTRAPPEVIIKALKQTTVEAHGICETNEENELQLKLTFRSPKGIVTLHAELLEVIAGTHIVEVVRSRGDHVEFYKLYKQLVERGNEIVEELMESKTGVFEQLPAKKSVPSSRDNSASLRRALSGNALSLKSVPLSHSEVNLTSHSARESLIRNRSLQGLADAGQAAGQD